MSSAKWRPFCPGGDELRSLHNSSYQFHAWWAGAIETCEDAFEVFLSGCLGRWDIIHAPRDLQVVSSSGKLLLYVEEKFFFF